MAISPTCIDPVRGHRLWAESYDTAHNPLLALERRVLQPHLDRLAGRFVVDVGCGTGRWLSFVSAAGANAVGMDLTAEMLAQAAAKRGLGGRLARADAHNLPVAAAAADVTLCSFCLSYVGDLYAVFGELARITRPRGLLILSDIHPAAITAGWKRTFRSAGQLYEMNLEGAPQGDPLRAGAQAGLALARVLEPRFAEPERALFEQAGKAAAFEAAARIPALLITLWERAG
jgi:ubiquinone/menaquinone biosynthesis C-methylase UbiE